MHPIKHHLVVCNDLRKRGALVNHVTVMMYLLEFNLNLLEKLENKERRKFKEKPHADPDELQSTEGENLRWVI